VEQSCFQDESFLFLWTREIRRVEDASIKAQLVLKLSFCAPAGKINLAVLGPIWDDALLKDCSA
jgi:hypothetical protein